MSRLLVATVPLTGHVRPMLVLVREMVDRGHDVHWYTGAKFGPLVRGAGAQFVPHRRARDWDDARLDEDVPALRGKRGLGRVKTQLRELFIAPMADQLADLEAIAKEHSFDAVIADSAHLGAALLSETHGLPWVGLGISALMVPSIDTAPFGTAYPPAPGPAGERRNKIMYQVVRWLFASVNRAYRGARVEAGVPSAGSYFDVLSPDLFLQPTVPSFEYPRRDLPAQVKFIGPLMPRSVPQERPVWWPDVVDAHAHGTPIVLVTQGTMATEPDELIAPSLAGLADEPVLVIVTGRHDGALPANARIAPFVPYELLLPMTSVMVTNGGYGGVQMALRHGVPLVVAGGSEEKPEIAARVAWTGVGIDLKTGRPSRRAVRNGVRRVLAESQFRASSRRIADEMARYDAPVRGVQLIEELVADATALPRRRAS